MKKSYYSIFIVFSFILVFASVGFAQQQEQTVDNYIFQFNIDTENIATGQSVKFTTYVKDLQGRDVTGLDVKYDIVREITAATETQSAHYSIDHTFSTIGEYDIVVSFVEPGTGREISTVFLADVQKGDAQFDMMWTAALVIGLLLIWGLYARKLMKKGKFIKGKGKKSKAKTKKASIVTPIALTVIYLIIIFLGFSVYAFYASPAVEGCEIKVGDSSTLHCHPYLNIDICGDSKGFNWEQGSLDAWHTHKDSHKLHIHPPRAVPQEEKIRIMNLQRISTDMGFVFTEDSIQDPKSGYIYMDLDNSCNDGRDNKVHIVINDQEISYQDAMSYLIQDGDKIRIKYE